MKNKFRTLTQGTKEDNILALMAKTFRTLCDYADWSKPTVKKVETKAETKDIPVTHPPNGTNQTLADHEKKGAKPSLHYNIQIHLPETRDTAVYDAIFKSLKEHLL